MSQNHSAEWLRGAVESHINTCNLITSITSVNESRTSRHGLIAANTELHNQLDSYRALLAEAEASEASVPTAADLAVADELDLLAAHIQQYIGPDDARDDIRRICRNRAADLRRGVKRGPSAAEVIATAERALYGIDSITRCVHLDMGGKHKYHIQHPGQHEAIEEVKRTLAAIAKWKEAHGGK